MYKFYKSFLQRSHVTFKVLHLLLVMILVQTVLHCQEPITRSLQIPHIRVTAFSPTDLFLV